MNMTVMVILLQVTTADVTQVDQLASPPGEPASHLPQAPEKPAAATIAQLPKDLEPLPGTTQSAPVASPTPTTASRATLEIARATNMIRGRGQEVTPELLAREVGPDVLNVYLAQTIGPPPAAGAPNATIPRTSLPATSIVPPGGAK